MRTRESILGIEKGKNARRGAHDLAKFKLAIGRSGNHRTTYEYAATGLKLCARVCVDFENCVVARDENTDR